MSVKSKQLVELATIVLTQSGIAKPYTAANRDHAAAVTAAVLREIADGLCCGGVLYDLADEIDGAEEA